MFNLILKKFTEVVKMRFATFNICNCYFCRNFCMGW